MITQSVGAGGVNAPADVREIQTLLNARAAAGLAVDGVCGSATLAAIRDFQVGIAGLETADGLISPTGPTYAALSAGAPPGPQPGPQPDLAPPLCAVLDLSHNNAGPIDFAALAASGVQAVILKASQGAGFRDPEFTNRLAAARQAGLLTGAYHFGTSDPVPAQLANFTGALRAAGGDFATVLTALDVEPNPAGAGATISLAQAADFVTGLRQQAAVSPLVYGGADYLGRNAPAALRACALWLAAYPANAAARPGPLPGWADWALWQYTDGTQGCYGGAFAGLRCDRSVFRGSPAELAAFWAAQGAAPAVAGLAGAAPVAG